MPGNKRRKLSEGERPSTLKVEAPSDDDSNDDEMPHPDAYSGDEEIEIDFEGRAPKDEDCHGISQLLQRVFLKAHINSMQMADVIIAQSFLGSVICQLDFDDGQSPADDNLCEDGTIFGITTVLNITKKIHEPCIEQLRNFVEQKATKYATKEVFEYFHKVLDDKATSVGYLINERFINIPAQISVPSLENLNSEITMAAKNGLPYKFVYYLMIIKFYRKEAKKHRPREDTYSNAEEELFAENAICSFEYCVADECDTGMSGDWLEGDATLIPFRKVILLDAIKLPQIIMDIQRHTNKQTKSD